MVFGVKGPKAMLAEAIAQALAMYFEVDQKKIEANLLTDTKIVLKEVRFKNQSQLVQKGISKSSIVELSGSVEEVLFSWTWSFSSKDKKNEDSGWVTDATLSIKGTKFQAQLSWVDNDKLDPILTTPPKTQKPAKTTKQEPQSGGMKSYIQKQVAMVMESLRLQLKDFVFSIVLPPTADDSSLPTDPLTLIVIGGKSIEITSLGKQGEDKLLKQILDIDSFFMSIIDQLSPTELTGKDHNKDATLLFPLMDSFSYRATSTRLFGERFVTGMGVGLEVIGESNEETGGLVLHAGSYQIKTIDRLMALILAPPESSNNEDISAGVEQKPEPEQEEIDIEESFNNMHVQEKSPSFFQFPLHSVSIMLLDTTKLVLPSMKMMYRADGTFAQIQAERLDVMPVLPSALGGEDTVSMRIQGIIASLRPTVELKLKVIEGLLVPGYVQLNKPIYDPEIVYTDDGLSVRISSLIDATRLIPPNITKHVDDKDASDNIKTISDKEVIGSTKTSIQDQATDNPFQKFAKSIASPFQPKPKTSDPEKDQNEETSNFFQSFSLSKKPKQEKPKPAIMEDSMSSSSSAMAVPLPVTISLDNVHLKKESATTTGVVEAPTKFRDMEISAIPMSDGSTHFSCCLGEMENEMLHIVNAAVSAVLPAQQHPDTIQKLKVAAESTSVTAGYSTEDWFRRFQVNGGAAPPPKQPTEEKKKDAPATIIYKLPGCRMERMNLRVAFKSSLVSAKDTIITIEPFDGNESTTSKDLVKYYGNVVIGRFPDLLTNADVLGINVVETGATTVGMALALGPLSGVAALTGVDAVKGAIAAGKRSRQKTEGDKTEVLDAFRGVWQAAKESADDGAKIRGKEGNAGAGAGAGAVDWVVGVTANNVSYVDQNKARLGGAGAGGGAMIMGTMVAGPIGGFAAGVVVSALTQRALGKLEAKKELEDGDAGANSNPKE